MSRQLTTLGYHTQNECHKAMEFLCCHYTTPKKFFGASTVTFAHLARIEMNTSTSLRKDAGQNLRITYRLSTRPFCAKFAYVSTKDVLRTRKQTSHSPPLQPQ